MPENFLKLFEDLCCAGGVTNFAKLGHKTFHPNYGKTHVVEAGKTECIFCGSDVALPR